jgi:choline dehydrogenase-like flavoprotein
LTEELAPSGEAESDNEIAYYIRGHCTTLYHPSSTCRMGVDAKAGFTCGYPIDDRRRVERIANVLPPWSGILPGLAARVKCGAI